MVRPFKTQDRHFADPEHYSIGEAPPVGRLPLRRLDQPLGSRVRVELPAADSIDELVECTVALRTGEHPRHELPLCDGEELAAGAVASRLLQPARLLYVRPVLLDDIGPLRDALALESDRLEDRNIPPLVPVEGQEDVQLLGDDVRAGLVRLVHDQDIGDLEDASLDRLDLIAGAGNADDNDRVR